MEAYWKEQSVIRREDDVDGLASSLVCCVTQSVEGERRVTYPD